MGFPQPWLSLRIMGCLCGRSLHHHFHQDSPFLLPAASPVLRNQPIVTSHQPHLPPSPGSGPSEASPGGAHHIHPDALVCRGLPTNGPGAPVSASGRGRGTGSLGSRPGLWLLVGAWAGPCPLWASVSAPSTEAPRSVPLFCRPRGWAGAGQAPPPCQSLQAAGSAPDWLVCRSPVWASISPTTR